MTKPDVRAARRLINREEILDRFEVDLINGKFFHKAPVRGRSGQEAGSVWRGHGKAYRYIKIAGRSYVTARLMFLVVHGRWPVPCVDHIDGDSLNDRPANLREATFTQNAWNHKGRAKKSDLPMGVRRTPKGRYVARIGYHKRQISLGAFDTPEEAHLAHVRKKRELFGEFAPDYHETRQEK